MEATTIRNLVEGLKTPYRITNGTAAGAHEVYFDGKPSEAVREALKGLKMRWNHKKVCWYGFSDESAIISAIQHSEAADVATDGYMGGGAYYGSKSRTHGRRDTLDAIREDIKAAGIKGVTARKDPRGYTPHYTFTVKVTSEDIIPREQFINAYEFNFRFGKVYLGNGKHVGTNDLNRMSIEEYQTTKIQAANAAYDKIAKDLDNYGEGMSLGSGAYTDSPEFTEELNKKIHKVFQIVEAYHWDESNAMVDYFNANFYYSVVAKKKAVEA